MYSIKMRTSQNKKNFRVTENPEDPTVSSSDFRSPADETVSALVPAGFVSDCLTAAFAIAPSELLRETDHLLTSTLSRNFPENSVKILDLRIINTLCSSSHKVQVKLCFSSSTLCIKINWNTGSCFELSHDSLLNFLPDKLINKVSLVWLSSAAHLWQEAKGDKPITPRVQNIFFPSLAERLRRGLLIKL